MPPLEPVYMPHEPVSQLTAPLLTTYLNWPGEPVLRTQASRVRRSGRSEAESGTETKSSMPSNRSAEPKNTPLIQLGSLASAPEVLPSVPLLPCPDQSRTTWPEPSFMGHQPMSGSVLALATAGTASAIARTAAAAPKYRRDIDRASSTGGLAALG